MTEKDITVGDMVETPNGGKARVTDRNESSALVEYLGDTLKTEWFPNYELTLIDKDSGDSDLTFDKVQTPEGVGIVTDVGDDVCRVQVPPIGGEFKEFPTDEISPVDDQEQNEFTREDALEQARDEINRRLDDEGRSIDEIDVIAGFWETYLDARFGVDVDVREEDVTTMQSLMYVARNATSLNQTGESELENFIDQIGYQANGAEYAHENNQT